MSKTKNKILKDINIIGGSAFGVLLALALRKDKSLNIGEITIFEKSNNILSSWNNHELGGLKVNRGFFGIEIPRGKDLISILGKDFTSSNFKSISNFKLLLINRNIIQYQYELEELPEHYRDEIIYFQKQSKNKHYDIFSKEFSNLSFFKILRICSQRYSDDPKDSEYLFYPWFFPKSSFDNIEDISGQTNKKMESSYLIPFNGIFSELVNNIEKLLEENHIKIKKNFSIDLKKINNSNKENYIWATSSSGIIKYYNPEALKNLKFNKRYLGLTLFKLNKEKLNLWENSFKNKPSEIITINIEIPSVSRISFPDHLDNKEFSFLLVEINSKNKKFVDNKELESIEKWLSEIFSTEVSFVESSLLGELYNPPLNSFEVMEKELDIIRKNIPVEIPFSYWWPINTSRAVKAVVNYCDKLKKRNK